MVKNRSLGCDFFYAVFLCAYLRIIKVDISILGLQTKFCIIAIMLNGLEIFRQSLLQNQ